MGAFGDTAIRGQIKLAQKETNDRLDKLLLAVRETNRLLAELVKEKVS